MGRLFNPDSALMRVLSTVGDLFLLNLLFLLCCIPVVTIGASLVGLYNVTMKMAANQAPGIVKTFFKAWKESFLKGLAFELIFAAGYALIGLGLTAVNANPEQLPWFFNAVYLLAFFLLSMLFCWTWPLEARFENGIGQTLKNAFRLGMANLGKSFCMVVLTLIPVLLLILSPALFAATGILWFLFGFSGIALLNAVLLNKALKPYLETE